jgi:hypothetical protein
MLVSCISITANLSAGLTTRYREHDYNRTTGVEVIAFVKQAREGGRTRSAVEGQIAMQACIRMRSVACWRAICNRGIGNVGLRLVHTQGVDRDEHGAEEFVDLHHMVSHGGRRRPIQGRPPPARREERRGIG